MKKILVACGTGVATSTIVANKVKDLLDSHCYKDKYQIKQVKITEVASLASDADFLISTTQPPAKLECDFVSGLAYLTGMGIDQTESLILELMEK